MKNLIRLAAVFVFFLFLLFPASALNFRGLDLSSDNRLLFRADSGDQHVLYLSRLTDLALQQLTAFPEKITVVENGRVLLAQNRFGAVRIPVAGGLPQPVQGFPAFAAGAVPSAGRFEQLAASADGRWILYIEAASAAYGNLTLLDTASGAKRVVTQKIERPAKDFPARWSPDSRLFVYAKGGRLFYFPLLHDLDAVADERFRQIGEGDIASAVWGQQGDFFYFKGNTLYRVRGPELFTRTIYGDFLSIGSVAGRFFAGFDPNFDVFYVAPDGRSVLLVKDGKNIFCLPLGENSGGDSVLPYVTVPGGVYDVNVLWSPSGLVTVIAAAFDRRLPLVWRFMVDGRAVSSLTPAETPAAFRCALSPDGTRALFWGKNGLELWDYVNWRLLYTVSKDPVYSCAWINSGEFALGGGSFIEGISVSGAEGTNALGRRRYICLSDAGEYGFEEGGRNRLLAKSGGLWFASDGKTPWAVAAAPQVRKASQVSGRYRVYLEPQRFGPYENLPMIRDITSVGTAPLFPAARLAAVPSAAAPQKIALCFDLYDDDTGLFRVLDSLRRYAVKATFFMNGDFIRSSPAAATAIANAGHEAASLFYAPIDLADSRYSINAEYITRGLARNEDEYFEATGKEISLLWHPPFYRNSAEVSAAASTAGYVTVNRDIDCGDWLGRDEAVKLRLPQLSAAAMIERIATDAKPGAVIPIRLGLLAGGRDDYLFQRIEVLLDTLISAGYQIVPVSELGAAKR
jgi:peptidoglycan/xylan/chitin deacetylase (PgdA/CDA1 family)